MGKSMSEVYREEDADSVNKEWLEAAKQSFEEAVIVHDWYTAQGIVEDIKDKFPDEGWALDKELADIKQSLADEDADSIGQDIRETE